MTDQNTLNVLVITTSFGTEQDEIGTPIGFFTTKGAAVTVASTDGKDVETLVFDKTPGTTVAATAKLSDIDPSAFDLLIIPGGTINADTLRVDEDAQAIVRAFAAAGKLVGAVCHAPWLFVNTDLARGRTVTSFFTLRRDLENAGATWVDEQVVVDTSQGFTTITSRNPDDLDAFNEALWAAVN